MYVCMYVCILVYMYIYIYVYMYGWMYICMYLWMYVLMDACIYVCLSACFWFSCMYVCEVCLIPFFSCFMFFSLVVVLLQAPSVLDAPERHGEFQSDFSFEESSFQQQNFPIIRVGSGSQLMMGQEALGKRDDIGM